MKLAQLLERLAESTKAYVARALEPIQRRISELDAAIKAIPAGEDGAPGRDGKDADVAALARMVNEAVAAAAGALPKPKDGKDVDLAALRDMVVAEVAKALSGLPAPKDGRDGKDIDPALLKQLIEGAAAVAAAALPKPRDGKDGADAQVDEKALAQVVERAIAALPKPRDGKDADPAEIKRLVDAAMAELPRPKDGAPGRSAYEAAVERGFSGTELQWLDSIQGRPGRDADESAIRKLSSEVSQARAHAESVADMVDEIAKGLGGFYELEAAPTGEIRELAASVANLEKTMRAPIVPLLDANGDVVGAQRATS